LAQPAAPAPRPGPRRVIHGTKSAIIFRQPEAPPVEGEAARQPARNTPAPQAAVGQATTQYRPAMDADGFAQPAGQSDDPFADPNQP
jgi:hypothetical protein